MPVIGFVILSHSNPHQLLRLVRTLGRMFGNPPVVCHHDLHQSPLDFAQFPRFCRFVQPAIGTRWAHISVVQAAMAAMNKLVGESDPDWIVLLSGADYPVQPARDILSDLENTDADAFLDYIEAAPWGRTKCSGNSISGSPKWGQRAYDRYVSQLLFEYPSLTKRLRPTKRVLIIRNRLVARILTPFGPNFRCFGGDHWFTVNRRAASALIEGVPLLIQYYEPKFVPEESIYHTVLCNRRDLRIHPDNKRYTDWAGSSAHPRVLEACDLAAIRRSGAHFARKFNADSPALGILDAECGA